MPLPPCQSTIHHLPLIIETSGSEHYFAVHVPNEILYSQLKDMQCYLSPDKFKRFTKNQLQRDNNRHHITITPPQLFTKDIEKNIKPYLGKTVAVNFIGLGRIQQPDNSVYFVVCQSSDIESIVSKLRIPFHDLHVTLGFEKHDVFDQPKDKSSLIIPCQ